jgi:hypothetical protein
MHSRKRVRAHEGGRKGVRAHSPHAQASGSRVGAASSESRTMAHRLVRRTTLGPTRACSERELTRERATGDGRHLDPLIGAPPFAGPTSKEGSSVGPRNEIRSPAPRFVRTDDQEVLEHRSEPGLYPPRNTSRFGAPCGDQQSSTRRARPVRDLSSKGERHRTARRFERTFRKRSAHPSEHRMSGSAPAFLVASALRRGSAARHARPGERDPHFPAGCAHDRSLLQKSIDDVSPQNARTRDTEAAPEGASPKRTNAEGERRVRARRENPIHRERARAHHEITRTRKRARLDTTSESKSRSGGVDR